MRQVTAKSQPAKPVLAEEQGVPDSNRVDPAPETAGKSGPDGGLTTARNSATADAAPVETLPLTPTPESDTMVPASKSIYRRYSELMHKYLKLQYELQDMKRPRRTQEQIERQIAAIQRFLGTMNDSEGAVTAANLYNEDFFAGEYDSKFKVPLLKLLTEKYRGAEPLIVPTYNYWVSLLEKEQTV